MRIRSWLLVMMLSLLALVSVVFSTILYRVQSTALIDGIDNELTTAIFTYNETLPVHYHDQITGPDSISQHEYNQIVILNTRLCRNAGLKYIHSLMLLDDRLVYTSATAPSLNFYQGDAPAFLQVYPQAQLYLPALNQFQPFTLTTERDGVAIRVAVVPFRDVGGRVYLVAAGRDMQAVEAELRSILLTSLGIGLLVMLAGSLICFLLARYLARPIETLTLTTREISAGFLQQQIQVRGASELVQLGNSINRMQQTIRDRIRDLDDSRENLRITLQSIGDAVIATDAYGRVTWLNPTAEHLTGWVSAEARGQTFDVVFQIINTQTGQPLESPVRRVIEQGGMVTLAEPTTLVARDGTHYQISDSAAPIHDKSQKIVGVVLVFRDVTGQYQKDQELQESKERFYSLYQNMTEGVALHRLIYDANGTPVNYIVLEVNQAYEKTLNLQSADVVNQLATKIYGVDEAPYLKEYAEVVHGGTPFYFETYFQPTDQYFYISVVKIGQDGFATIFFDLTNIRKVEAARANSERLLRQILDNTPIAFYKRNHKNRTYEFMTSAIEQISGFTVEEMMAMDRDELANRTHPDDLPALQEYQQAVFTGGSLRYHFEFRFKHKDGNYRWWEEKSQVFLDEQGQPSYSVVSLTDISERKQIELALKESEERYRVLINHAGFPIIVTDPTLSQVLFVNNQALNYIGLTPAEAMSSNPRDYWKSPEILKLYNQTLERDGRLDNWEVELFTTAEKTVWCNVSASVITFEGKTAHFMVLNDITERKQAEVMLHRTQFLVDYASEGILCVEQDGKIFYANEMAHQLAGVKLGNLIGSKVWEHYLHYDAQKWQEQWAALVDKKELKIEDAGVSSQGGDLMLETTINYVKFGDQIFLVYFMRDITERKEAEQTLRVNIDRLNLSQKIGQVGSWEYNLVTGMFWGSRETFEIYGLEPAADEVSLGEIESHIPENKKFHQHLVELIQGVSKFNFKHEVIPAKKLPARVVITMAELVTDENHNLVKVAGAVLDVTERERIQEEIRRLNADLEQRVVERTARLEATIQELEAFSYSVSHDLRAPLRSIDGFSTLLMDDYNDLLDDQGKMYLNRVRGAARHMGNLIEDLLKLSRITRAEVKHTPVNLSEIAQRQVKELQESDPDRQVEWVIAPKLMVHGDEHLLEVAINNLLSNAFKFTAKHASARIELGFIRDGRQKIFFVRDDGAGFDMQYANKLFGAFQRLHSPSQFEGTGVGLATVQRIIQRHGGRVWAESAVEQGATFYFTLAE